MCTIKFLCLEIVRHSFHTRVSSDSYAIVQCLVKKKRQASAVRQGRESVHVVFLFPVPGWSEAEEAQLQQCGPLRGGVGGQRRLCRFNLSMLMSPIIDSKLICTI